MGGVHGPFAGGPRSSTASNWNSKARKVFLLTAVLASGAGLLAGGCWTWMHIPMCPQQAINVVDVPLPSGNAQPKSTLERVMAPRRLSRVDQVKAAFYSNGVSHEKSLAELKNWRDILGILIIAVSCIAAVSAGTGGKRIPLRNVRAASLCLFSTAGGGECACCLFICFPASVHFFMGRSMSTANIAFHRSTLNSTLKTLMGHHHNSSDCCQKTLFLW